jgi:hypothetical protein
MSDTPETDQFKGYWATKRVDRETIFDVAQRLERERDEARKEAEWARDLIDGWSEASCTKFPWENPKLSEHSE